MMTTPYSSELKAKFLGMTNEQIQENKDRGSFYSIRTVTTLTEGIIVYKKTTLGYRNEIRKGKRRTVRNDYITTLYIPAGSRVRWDLMDTKCRASQAVVIKHEPIKGAPEPKRDVTKAIYDELFRYKVATVVKPNLPFLENGANTCGSGIHFFLTKQEARRYPL